MCCSTGRIVDLMSAELEMLRSETELAEKVTEGSHQKAIILSSAGGRGQMHRVWLSMLKTGDNLTVTVRTPRNGSRRWEAMLCL